MIKWQTVKDNDTRGITMKKAILFSIIVSIGTVNAAVYKCGSESGKIMYQDSPCNNQSQAMKVAITPIDPKKVKRAQKELVIKLEEREKQEQQFAEVDRKERELRARELSARAELDLAYETRRQTDAIEDNTRAVNQNAWGGYNFRRIYQHY